MPFYLKNKQGQTTEISAEDIMSIAATGKAKRVDPKTGETYDKVFLTPEKGVSFREKLVGKKANPDDPTSIAQAGRLYVTIDEVPGGTFGLNGLPPELMDKAKSQIVNVGDSWLTNFYERKLNRRENEDFGDGHIIPTLGDLGGEIAKMGAKAMSTNPFAEDTKRYKREYDRTGTESSKKKYDTYKGMGEAWEKELNDMNPDEYQWGTSLDQRVGKFLEEGPGSRFDAVDVGTAFLPAGALAKGAGKVGGGLSGIKGAGTLARAGANAGKVLSIPTKVIETYPKLGVVDEALEQAIIEGAHGAVNYRPEEGESMGANAVEKGLLAGGLQGIVSGFGGGRKRAVLNLPENRRALGAIDELRKQGVDVPKYSPFARAGKEVLGEGEVNDLVLRELEKANELVPPGMRVSEEELSEAIEETIKEMRAKGYRYPLREGERFTRGKFNVEDVNPVTGQISGDVVMPWETSIRNRIVAPVESGSAAEFAEGGTGYSLMDILSETYRKPIRSTYRSGGRIGEPIAGDVEGAADRVLAKNILKKKGLYRDPVETAAKNNEYVVFEKTPKYNSEAPGGLEIKLDDVPQQIEQHLENVEDIRGLGGLKYADKPMKKAAETGFNKMVSQVPGISQLPRIYETQVGPTITNYDLGALWDRVVNNVLLDAAREGGEVGLDYLDKKYKKEKKNKK